MAKLSGYLEDLAHEILKTRGVYPTITTGVGYFDVSIDGQRVASGNCCTPRQRVIDDVVRNSHPRRRGSVKSC